LIEEKHVLLYFLIVSLVLMLVLFKSVELGLLTVAALCYALLTFLEEVEVRAEVSRKVRPVRGTIPLEVEVTTEITYLGRRPVVALVEDALPPRTRVIRGANVAAAELRKGTKVVLSYVLKVENVGAYEIGPVKVYAFRSNSPSLTERIIGGVGRFIAWPKYDMKMKQLPMYYSKKTSLFGEFPLRKAGYGTEFHSLRQTMRVRDLKRVNWKATAKFGKIVVNEYVDERTIDTVLIVDYTKADVELPDGSLLKDHVATLASTISYHLVMRGNRIGAIIYERKRSWLRIGYGKRYFKLLTDLLSSAEPLYSAKQLSYIVSYLLTYISPKRSQVIVISPMLDEEILSTMHEIVGRGYSVLVLYPKLYAEEDDVALRYSALKQQLISAKVARYCPTFPWDVRHPVRAVFRRVYAWKRILRA